ncbi:MAG TPA: type II toxin-antitoxin system HicA family toxin [Methylomirabilota bacterium]|nr:type II toxin-antitoxin system HicA family toxin [Methylomirabilota bacterium]
MSPKLPVISGEDLIRVLRKFGYEVVRQKGSHVRLRNELEPRRLPVTVPLHKEIAPGTLKSVLSDASISAEELLAAL